MSCVTDQYVKRARNVVEDQYVSIKSVLERILNLQGYTTSQRSFIRGTRSLNEKDLEDNPAYFKVPQVDIESFRSFDEYTKILKGMYSTRFNGSPKDNDTHDQMTPTDFKDFDLFVKGVWEGTFWGSLFFETTGGDKTDWRKPLVSVGRVSRTLRRVPDTVVSF